MVRPPRGVSRITIFQSMHSCPTQRHSRGRVSRAIPASQTLITETSPSSPTIFGQSIAFRGHKLPAKFNVSSALENRMRKTVTILTVVCLTLVVLPAGIQKARAHRPARPARWNSAADSPAKPISPERPEALASGRSHSGGGPASGKELTSIIGFSRQLKSDLTVDLGNASCTLGIVGSPRSKRETGISFSGRGRFIRCAE